MSQVVINDETPRTQLISTAGQTVFNTNWTADAATDIDVYARADGVEPDDITQIVSTSLYNVTFIGGSETVRVTFLSGRTLDDVITIVRNTPAERLNLYINTNFVPSMLNQDFGILTLVDQQAQMYDTVINPGYNVSATIEQDTVLGGGDKILPILGANQIWAKNNANTEIIAYDVPANGGVAPKTAKYIIQTATTELPFAQAMGSLASGLVVNTSATGVQLTRTLTGTTNQISIANGTGIAGNPTVAISANPKLSGTEGLGIPTGTTAQRPVAPSGTELRQNTTLGSLEYWDGAAWAAINDGSDVDSLTGTANQVLVNATSGVPTSGPVILTLPNAVDLPGTLNIQSTNAVSAIINDDTLATATSSNIATALSLKAYIDAKLVNLNIQGSCVAASTTALTVTYANGASGVGATLTNADVQAAISLDGVSPTLGQRVLIKNQASTLQNGIYTVSVVGDGATNWVLTRATDFDTPAEIQPGDWVVLTGGTTQAQSSWLQTSTVTTVGTDAVVFVQFTVSLPVNVASGGTGLTTLNAYRLLAAGTTSTGALQQIVAGTSGALLQSAGAGALAAYTTTTYPVTNAIHTMMYASSANVLSVITPANSSALLSNGSGVPAWVTNSGTGNNILQTSPTITTPIIAEIQSVNSTIMLTFSSNASAVNYVNITDAATGSIPTIKAVGSDTNIGLRISGKGTSGLTLVGVTLNVNGITGSVGEFLTSTLVSGSKVTLSTGVSANVTTLSLTAGDWDVSFNLYFETEATTTVTKIRGGLSTVSATLATGSTSTAQFNNLWASFTPGTTTFQANGASSRQLLAATTDIHLVANSTFGVANMFVYGWISARRRR